jgi:glycosyltransferase involved in cell wall biosynthesis
MSVQPKISVVMPLFNKRLYVGESLHSVANQSFKDFEVVVVDDGSTDDSASVVRSMNLPGLRLITQENAGVSAARNQGIKLARSDLIAFIDADDLWREDHLLHLWHLSEAYPDAGLLSNEYVEASDARSACRSRPVQYHLMSDFVAEAANGTGWIFTSATMVRRQPCLLVGGFEVDESRGEDIDLWIRMSDTHAVARSDYIGCIYRRVAGGLTSSRLVVEPDVSMRRISTMLDSIEGLSSERRRNLTELRNRLAIAHATDCLLQGHRNSARGFLAEAAGTTIYRRRRRVLVCLSMLPRICIVILVYLRQWVGK